VEFAQSHRCVGQFLLVPALGPARGRLQQLDPVKRVYQNVPPAFTRFAKSIAKCGTPSTTRYRYTYLAEFFGVNSASHRSFAINRIAASPNLNSSARRYSSRRLIES